METLFSQITRCDTSMAFTEGQHFEFTLSAEQPKTQEFSEVLEAEQAKLNTPAPNDGVEYKIQVKKYMTEKSSPRFDFMANWNNDVPMPFVIMSGTIEKETRGMYYMKLHGKAERTSVCMCCGKKLTHPVSMLYGLGPECGQHAYINPFNSEEELQQCIDEVYKKIADVKWEGWVIKSAIKTMEVTE